MNRSENMRAITSKDTSIEIKLGKALWHNGFRYRKNSKDILENWTYASKKVAIFFDSEFRYGKYLLENKYIQK